MILLAGVPMGSAALSAPSEVLAVLYPGGLWRRVGYVGIAIFAMPTYPALPFGSFRGAGQQEKERKMGGWGFAIKDWSRRRLWSAATLQPRRENFFGFSF